MDSEPKYVPWPPYAWNEILPNLFQGGQIATVGVNHEHPNVVRVTDEFDIVYSLFWRDEDGNGPDDGVSHVHNYIPDGALSAQQLSTVRSLASAAMVDLARGRRVLVRCQAGYNRSGLMVAFILLGLGYTADEAIDLIRRKRSLWALHNEHFVEYIHEEGKRWST